MDPSVSLEEWAAQTGWRMTSGDRPKPLEGSQENAVYALVVGSQHKRLHTDVWSGGRFCDGHHLEDTDITAFKMWIEGTYHDAYRYTPSTNIVKAAVEYLCSRQQVNRRRDEVLFEEWDGQTRYLGLAEALGQDPNDDYIVEVCKLIVRGVVVRVLHPGAEFPYCPVLIGKQGAGKGRFLKTISGGYHSELEPAVFRSNKGLQSIEERFRGRSVVEISEFAGMRGEPLYFLKGLITNEYLAGVRVAYGREARDWPVTAILVGTTNTPLVLTDDDNRRFPVLTIPDEVDVPWVEENVQQLWAEAVYDFEWAKDTMAHLTLQGLPAYMMIDEHGIVPGANWNWAVRLPSKYWPELRKRSEAHRETSPLEEWLAEHLESYEGNPVRGQSLAEAARRGYGRYSTREFSDAMQALDWHKRAFTRADGSKTNVWEKGGRSTGEPVDFDANAVPDSLFRVSIPAPPED